MAENNNVNNCVGGNSELQWVHKSVHAFSVQTFRVDQMKEIARSGEEARPFEISLFGHWPFSVSVAFVFLPP